MNVKSKSGKPIDAKTRGSWKHYMYKYTSIPTTLVLNPRYVKLMSKKGALKKQTHWLDA